MAPADHPRSRVCRAAFCLLALLLSTGCSLSHFSDLSTASSALPVITGNVHGGQQPVAGSTISLYAANILTAKGASTPIPLAPAVTTDGNGNFTLTGRYACPTPNSLVYITSTGGNPGLTNQTTNNTSIALMTAIGTCSSLLLGGNNVFISINELTTVAAVEALAPYMADITHIGANLTTDPNALSNAFVSANSIVSSTNGQYVPQPAGATVPYLLYNTLADIAAACINTAGNTGATSICYKLFANTSNSLSDTIAALLYMAQNPATNVAALYALIAGTGVPFQPMYNSAPATFVPALIINVPNNGEYRCCTKQQLAIDTSQQIWVGNSFTHQVHVYSNAGALLYTIDLPQALLNMAADPLGNVWFVVQAASSGFSESILKYNSSGVLLSPAAGFQANVGSGPQLYSYVATATDMKFDSTGNLFLTAQQAGTGNYCSLKYATTGTYLQPICLSANGPVTGIVLDGSDNVYLAQAGGVNKLFKFTNLGVSLAFTTQPTLTSIVGTYFMHYDPSTDHIWIFDGNDVAIFATNGTTIKARFQDALYFSNPFYLDGGGNGFTCCGYPYGLSRYDATGTRTSPDLSTTNTGVTYSGFQYQGQNLQLPTMQVDGLGNVWGVGGDSILVRLSGGIAVPRPQLYR